MTTYPHARAKTPGQVADNVAAFFTQSSGVLTARVWMPDESRTRVYYVGNNAAKAEYGYSEMRMVDGKVKMTDFVATGKATGYRSAMLEVEKQLRAFRAERKAIRAAMDAATT